MTQKKRNTPKKQHLKPLKTKATTPEARSKSRRATLLSILPQALVIAVCVGIYYAMFNFYLFFAWGLYVYYLIKLIIAFEILASAFRSLLIPLAALVLGLAVLFTNCLFLNTLMNTDTAWELSAVALAGIVITVFIRARAHQYNKGR